MTTPAPEHGAGTAPWRGYAVLAVAAAAAVFHLYGAGFAPFTALVQRPVHLALMGTLAFLGVGVRTLPRSRRGWALNAALGAALVFCALYLVSQHEALVSRSGSPTALDLGAGAVVVAMVLLLAKRATGWGLVVVATGALGYALLGPWLPGILAHRGYNPGRLIEQLFLSTEGIWGVPLGVSADFVFLFVLFGAFLDVAGGGALLIGLADRVAGRTRGGPAKTAAVASAFILATWTNIPYARVALAAAIPAILYYAALLWAIHFRATKVGLKGSVAARDEAVLPRIHLLLPVIIIVVMLALGRSPMRAAFWGVVVSLLAAYAVPGTRPDGGKVARALKKAGSGAVQVAAACAAAGIVVGVASLTGIGLRMSELIVVVSQGNLMVALILTAIGSIILGMGLPTTAAYVVLAALGAPALVELGVPLLGAHLFIFYFGCISNVTPPVSLAAYAAAGIADSPPLKTAWTAMGLASAGFLVPFMFIYAPPLILAGTVAEIATTTLTALIGVVALAGAVIGHVTGPLALWRRIVLMGAAIALIAPGLMWDGIGLALLLGAAFLGVSRDNTLSTRDNT